MTSPTANKGYTYPAHGGAVNAWDTPLNDNFDQIDKNVAGFYPVAVSTTITGSSFQSSVGTIGSTATTATPSASIAQNMAYRFTGTMGASLTFVLPTAGSFYIIDNQMTSTGYTFKVNTAAGSSGTTVPSGGSNLIYTSTLASNPAVIVGQFAADLYTTLGTPAFTATAGSAEGNLTDCAWDATNKQFYVCVTSGTSATAVFIPTNPRIVPEGYLTLSTDADNPILTADAASKTAVYYTPFTGNWTLVSDGTALYPHQFSQQSLSLIAGAHAANSIYDVFIYQSTTASSVVIGTGPAWTAATAGAGARGSGAGTSQLAKLNGLWTNAVQVTLTNGASTYTCPINQGVYLGSIFIDGTAGQVSCYRSFGQNRKWGVWNNYNRQQIILKMGDNTASWTNGSSVIRYANNSTANNAKSFAGLPEATTTVEYISQARITIASGAGTYSIGVGWNSTSAFSGTVGYYDIVNNNANNIRVGNNNIAKYVSPPALGMQEISALEQSTSVDTWTVLGTEASMQLNVNWLG